MKNKKLLFFFSDDKCTNCTTVIPTLKKIADEFDLDFESYICSRPNSWPGKVFPALGNGHIQSFYYLANFYDEILYCSISSYGSFQFRREVLAFGGKVLSARSNDEIIEFYEDIYKFFGKALPESVMVMPAHREGKDYFTPFCYPDVVSNEGFGIDEDIWNTKKDYLKAKGVTKVKSLYCDIEGAEAIDSVKENDSYGSITKRIADRHIDSVKQFAFINAEGLFRWQTHFMLNDIVVLYEEREWEAFMPTISEYAEKIGNRVLIGNQVVYAKEYGVVRDWDHVIAEMGKYNMILNLVGVNPRIGFNIQTSKKLPLDWLEDENVNTPWDDEYSDEYLTERLEKGDIPVCFLLYASDLGHLPGLPNFINMCCLDGMKAGIAFPSSWYKYNPEILEQLYIPLEQGGCCPNLEPLVCSVGTAVATEAEGFIAPEMLTSLINTAMDEIKDAVGERRLPRGYYPFQDSTPYYVEESGTPQYDAVSKVGFEYYITYLHYTQPAAIQYQKNGMTVLRQQTHQWFPGYGDVMTRLLEWEERTIENQNKRLKGEKVDNLVDWVIMAFDTPFYGLTPNCYGESEASKGLWNTNVGMERLFKAMQYVRRTGGKEGRLFLVKPHELYRFAKIAQEKGMISPEDK